MFALTSAQQYYLCAEPTDMRKSFDALSSLISFVMERNPVSGEVFVFINKTKNKMKLLHWEYGGFVLYYKRLESGTFELPVYDKGQNSFIINWSQLVMMVEGISMKNIVTKKRYKAHANC
jgi:transposase